MSETAGEPPDQRESNEDDALGHSQLVILLAAFADVAFTAAVAAHVAFADVSLRLAVVVAASALTFVVSTIVALVAARRRVVIVATVLVTLAGLSAAVVAIGSARRYDALRREAFGDRAGVRLVEPDSARGRRMGAAMLSSISASLAAITALPIAGYFAVRVFRAGGTP